MSASTSTGVVIPPPILSEGFEFNSSYDASLESIAATNVVELEWNLLKDIIKFKLAEIMSKYLAHGPPWPLSPEQALEARNRAFDSLDTFTGPPFTIQRITELILAPTSHYTTLPKYLRALNRVLNVSSERSAYTEDDNLQFHSASSISTSLTEENYEATMIRDGGIEGLGEGGMTPTKRPTPSPSPSPSTSSATSSLPPQHTLLSPIPWLNHTTTISPTTSPSSSLNLNTSLSSHTSSSSSPPPTSRSSITTITTSSSTTTTTPSGGVVDELDPGTGTSEAIDPVALTSVATVGELSTKSSSSSSLQERFVRAGSPKILDGLEGKEGGGGEGGEGVRGIENVLEG